VIPKNFGGAFFLERARVLLVEKKQIWYKITIQKKSSAAWIGQTMQQTKLGVAAERPTWFGTVVWIIDQQPFG